MPRLVRRRRPVAAGNRTEQEDEGGHGGQFECGRQAVDGVAVRGDVIPPADTARAAARFLPHLAGRVDGGAVDGRSRQVGYARNTVIRPTCFDLVLGGERWGGEGMVDRGAEGRGRGEGGRHK